MNANEIEATIKEAIENDIRHDAAAIKIHTEIARILKKFDGKKITRRMQTAVQKAQPGWTVYYNNDYGSFHIEVWGGDTGRASYADRMSVHLAYSSTGGTFSIEKFEEYDTCHGRAAIERNKNRIRVLLNTRAIAEAYMAFTKAHAVLKEALGNTLDNASWYSIRDTLGLKNMV